MGITLLLFICFSIMALITKLMAFRQPLSKIKASWLSFAFALIATTVCTLLFGGEQQSTLLTGFATMLVCYNIFIR